MPTYPAPPPTITGDVIQINRFLNSPTLVQRRLRDVTSRRFLTDVIFTGRVQASGGAVLYEIGESMFTAKDPESVQPGGQYPRFQSTTGSAALAAVAKWGEDVPLTDERIARMGGSALQRTFVKVGNTVVRKFDSIGMAAAGAAVTQHQTQFAAWDAATADPFLDVMLADAQIEALDEGYETDALVLTDVLYARMVSNQKVINGLARESSNTVTSEGEVTKIAGKMLLRSNRLPAGVDRLLVDTTQFGAIGYEDLQSPEYSGDAAGVQSWARRNPDANDEWLVRGRRNGVPIVLEPASGITIGA